MSTSNSLALSPCRVRNSCSNLVMKSWYFSIISRHAATLIGPCSLICRLTGVVSRICSLIGVRCALSHFCCVYNKTVVQWYTRPPQRGPVDCPSSTVPGISPHVPPDRGAAPTAPPPAGGIVLPFPRALFDSVSVLRDPLPPRPPHAAPHIMDQRRHHERADEDRIEQHAEGDDEGELEEEHDRDDREGREGRGEHDPRRGDHPTRGHQPREHS